MRYFMVLIAVVALLAFAVPASAETCFNEMSKCIQTFGKGCCGGSSAAKTECVKSSPKDVVAVDALGNDVSLVTDNSGKSQLGI
jgi:hypothetical protein